MSRYSGTDSTTDTGRHCFTNWGHWVTISRGRRRRGARQVMVWIQHTVVSVSGLGENETGSTQFIGFTWTRPAVSQSSHIYSVCLQSEWFEKYLCAGARSFFCEFHWCIKIDIMRCSPRGAPLTGGLQWCRSSAHFCTANSVYCAENSPVWSPPSSRTTLQCKHNPLPTFKLISWVHVPPPHQCNYLNMQVSQLCEYFYVDSQTWSARDFLQ